MIFKKRTISNSNLHDLQAMALPVDFKRIGALLLAGYAILVVMFYFLAGEQLRFRESRDNLELLPASFGTMKLAAGSSVEQTFVTEIQRLEEVSVQWGSYGRPNAGTVRVELVDLRSDTVLLSQEFNAGELTEALVSTIKADPPLEGLYQAPLMLRILFLDSQPGSAVCLLMSGSPEEKKGFFLRLNGAPADGRLCFALKGTDYIWTGLHYWKFAAAGALLLLAYMVLIAKRAKDGKSNLLLNAFVAIQKYRFLIRQLVSRDFKSKYKRSVLGVLWSFFNPLLTMTVQYLVFSNLFRFDLPHYPVYLISGIVMFNFFTEACGMALGSIVGNASLITKVYVPKYIYPLTRVLSSMVNLVISLIPLLLVVLASGLFPTKAYLLLFFELVCLTVFCLGLGMMLASAMVFFRDMQFLWGVLSMIWMYLTPLFYPESILPEGMRFVLKINPMYYFVRFTRICVIDGVSPEPIMYLQCALFALGSLVLGAWVFKKTQDKFVLYL